MAALDTLRDKWENITPRERMLVVVLGIGLVVTGIALLTMSITRRLDAMERNNDRMRQALDILEVYRVNPKEAGEAELVVPPTAEALKVDTYIVKVAERVGIKLGTPIRPKAQQTRPNGMFQHPYEVQVNELPLEQARTFLEAIETDNKLVAVTALNMKRSFADRAKVDIKLEVSTYSNPNATPPAAPGGATGTGTGTAPAPGTAAPPGAPR
jgi:hypothetical protein